MKWFKHYNTASEGQSLELLISEKDFETAFIYWWLLEQVSKFEDTSCDEKRGRITLNFSLFKRKLGLNFQRTERVLLKIAKTFNLEIIINLDKTIEVFIPKWLELQENRGGKREAKDLQKNSKDGQEVRSKNKDKEYIHSGENVGLNFSFNDAYKLYIVQIKGPKAEKRFKEQIKTQKDFDDLVRSIANYKTFLKKESWRKPKQAFDTFLGSESSGYFWREFIDYKSHAPIVPKKEKITEEPFVYNEEAKEKHLSSDNPFLKLLKIKEVPK